MSDSDIVVNRLPNGTIAPGSQPQKRNPDVPSRLSQIADMQATAYKDALKEENGIKKAALMRAWRDLEDMRRKILGEADPRPEDKSKAGKARRPPIEVEPSN